MTAAVNPPTPDSADDQLLADLIEEYTARAQAGEPVDVESFAQAHPEQAERLRRLLPGVRVLVEMEELIGAEAPAGADPETAARPGGSPLGDFRVIREVGRGGMGVVFEAEQLSLRRRVALKVLPFAAAIDERRLQRFRNEAQAAAGLHHSNIVPVFFVGCERGVHFYAMQYIEGRTLASVIDELRQEADQRGVKRPAAPAQGAGPSGEPTTVYVPGPDCVVRVAETVPQAALSTEGLGRGQAYYRRVAQLGVQAAEALDYAHERGVIHRDIKPANLILDSQGTLWVTDFGLAHLQHAEGGLTMTGALVGTLRYMSPEQALAKRVVVDHRTDVYSLGATLYELLTLRPALTGGDRQELLRQIAFEEPVRPRRLDRSIPAELETIVLKALEKNPQDRYATAQELADDLRRFLEDQPIRARRPSLQRARKWARRHRPVVWATAAVFLLAVLLGGGTWLWWFQKRVLAEGDGRAGLQEAIRFQREQKWPEALSAIRRAKGVLAGVSADPDLLQEVEQLGKDLELVSRLQEARLLRMASKELEDDWEASNAAYVSAFGWYGLEVDSVDPQEAGVRIQSRSVCVEVAAALDDWALVRKIMGLKDWSRPLAISRVADPDPSRNRLRDALCEGKDSRACKELATFVAGDELPPATAVLLSMVAMEIDAEERGVVLLREQALVVLRQARRRHPDDYWVNIELRFVLATLGPAHRNEELHYATAAVSLRPQSPLAHLSLGTSLQENGQLDEAIAEYHEAIRLKKDLPEAHYNLGRALNAKGQLDEAIAEYHEAIRLENDDPKAHNNLGLALAEKGLLNEAIAEYHEAIRIKNDDPKAHYNLGLALAEKGLLNEAIAEYREAIRIKRDDPGAHNNLGIALADKGRLDEAEAEFREAIRIKNDYPGAHINLGSALKAKGQLDEAIAAYREAIHLKKADADAHNNLGNALKAKGQMDEAIAEYREAIRIKNDDPKAHYNLGNALADKGRLDEAIAEYREAIRIKNDFAEALYNLGVALADKGQFAEALNSLLIGHELGSKNPRWPYPSAQLVKEFERLVELDARLPGVLKGEVQPRDVGERLALAQMCQLPGKSLYAAAVRFYADAFAEQPRLADDLQRHHRYNAACAAALAGCGQGKDAEALDDKERARLRRQALDWLQADLTARRGQLKSWWPGAADQARQALQHWQEDSNFGGVRGPEALTKLPQTEREAWKKLWADVADTLAQAQEKVVPTKKSDTK